MSLITKTIVIGGVIVVASVGGIYYAANQQANKIDQSIDLYIETIQKKANAVVDISVIKKKGTDSSFGEFRFTPKKELNVAEQSINIKYEITHGISSLLTKEYPITGTYVIKYNDEEVVINSNGKENEIEGVFDGIINNSANNMNLNSTLNAFTIGDEKNTINIAAIKTNVNINQSKNLGKIQVDMPSISDDKKMVAISNVGFKYQFDLKNINLYEGSFNIKKIEMPALNTNIDNVGLKMSSFLNNNKKLDMTFNLMLEKMNISGQKDISFELNSLFGGINKDVVNAAEKILNAPNEKEAQELFPKLQEAAIKNLNDGVYFNLKTLNLKKGSEYIKANGDFFIKKEEKNPLNIELSYEAQSNADLGIMVISNVSPVNFLTDESMSLMEKVKENQGKLTVTLKNNELKVNGEIIPLRENLKDILDVPTFVAK